MERSGTREGTASDDGTALRARPEAEIAGLKAILAQRDRVPAERDRLVSELQGSRERNAARGTRHDRFAARLCPNTVARRGAGGPSWSDRTE